MLDYKTFKACINTIRVNNKTSDKLEELLGVEGIIALFCGSNSAIINLLTHIFNDEEGWLEYWVYELNMGEDYYEGCVVDADGENIVLQTSYDMYVFLNKKSS
jgi:hypothetical protein